MWQRIISVGFTGYGKGFFFTLRWTKSRLLTLISSSLRGVWKGPNGHSAIYQPCATFNFSEPLVERSTNVLSLLAPLFLGVFAPSYFPYPIGYFSGCVFQFLFNSSNAIISSCFTVGLLVPRDSFLSDLCFSFGIRRRTGIQKVDPCRIHLPIVRISWVYDCEVASLMYR